ncbi:ABC transporter permease [Pelomonas sp. SE-A7]|uniref:ABC transporter permease n=1 Tax=Pelomonas sp. SE-A7 TaxID=3054953 RepID=UPI00259CCE5F|nr:ABC transporter permease [Pelomonas sp. SE-A7]MDM4765514.1 ABC transporter permease [Pelomonas sp. SE-A7]
MQSLLDDLRQAFKSLAKAPGFSLLALLTLSCGLGFAAYCLAIYLGAGRGDIPYPEAHRLLALEATRDKERTQSNSIHYLDYQAYAAGTTAFEGLLPLNVSTVTLADARHFPENFRAARVPAALWPWLGERPQTGRMLQASDEQPGAAPVAVIGAQVWQSLLGSDPKVVGSRIKVNGVDTEIVGVMPASLSFPLNQQLWLPFTPPTVTNRPGGYSMGTASHVMVLGRLKPDASQRQAERELKLVAQQLATSFPVSNQRVGVMTLKYSQWGMPDADSIYLGLSVAASLLLALVGINTGNLLLARANERRQEVAVRAALGAPRGRLIQQMLCEALLLSGGGALLGLFFSAWALALTQRQITETVGDHLPFWLHFGLSPTAAFGALALSLLVALTVGGLPALRASRIDVAAALRDGQRGSSGRAAGYFSKVLVMIQIVLCSLLLLVSGGSSYQAQQQLNSGTGARMEGVMTAQLVPRIQAYRGQPAARDQLWARLETALREQAGTAGVAMSTALPGGGMYSTESVQPEGLVVRDEQFPDSGVYSINAGYLKALEVPMLSGREFDGRDRLDSLKVAVVNRNFAEQHWPGQDPLGKRFAVVADPKVNQRDWITIVGVVGPLVQGRAGPEGRRSPNVYLPITQSSPDRLDLALVGVPDNGASRELLARAVAKADPALALEKVYSAEQRERVASSGNDVIAALCLVLGLMSLLLAVTGIYGVTSRAVALRTQEIGVRRAVGASDSAVLWLLLRQGLWQLGLGLPLGLFLGWVALSQMSDMGGAMLTAAVLVGLLIGTIVMLATWLPARRAIALIPNAALRCE